MLGAFDKNRQCFCHHHKKSMVYVMATYLRKRKDVKQICNNSGPGAKSDAIQPKSAERTHSNPIHITKAQKKGRNQ